MLFRCVDIVKNSLVSLGSGTEFNIKAIYPNYRTLTEDNFIIEASSVGYNKSIDFEEEQANLGGNVSVSYSFEKTYSSATGKLYVDCKVSVNGTVEEESVDDSENITINVYLILPDYKKY